MEDRAMTPIEVAQTLRIAKNTVYELIKRGELKGYRVGKKFRIDREEVLAYRRRGNDEGAARDFESGAGNPEADASGGRASAKRESAANARFEAAKHGAFVLCGQDIMLDLIGQRIESTIPGSTVQRSFLGSYNGLHALYQGAVDAATAHLWDGETDSYNIPYLRHILPGMDLIVVRLASRMVGFYVQAGNPKKLRGWEDLRRPGLRMVNREKGSGIRVLLDERLKTMGIDRRALEGYDRKCDTHLAVAVAVARGGADFALGNEKTAAQVSGIEFVPLQKESYDLVVPKDAAEVPACRALVDIARSAAFREELEGLGGYGLEETGRLILG